MSSGKPDSAVVGGSVGPVGGRPKFAAFLVDEASEKTVRQSVKDMQLSNSDVMRLSIEKATAHLSSKRTPLVLMVDVSGTKLPVNAVDRLSDVCEPGVSLIVVGDRNDVGLYRDLVRAGVSDYLVKPLSRGGVQEAIEAQLTQDGDAGAVPLNQKQGKVVAIMGARGGVGVTTVLTSLASQLANNEKRRVALIDLDVHFGDCAFSLDLKLVGGLREVLESPQRLDDLFVERSMIAATDRLFVLAAEERMDQPVNFDPAALDPLIALLKKQFHYVLVDLPRRHGTYLNRMMELADVRVIVADQTGHSVRDTLRLRALLDAPKAGQRNVVVLNRVGEKGKGDIDAKLFVEAVGLPIDVQIPYHPKSIVTASNAGKSLINVPGPLAQSIQRLSRELGGRNVEEAKRGWRFFR